MDLIKVKHIAIQAAYRSAKILMSYFGRLPRIDKKGEIDLITVADLESEKHLIQTIQTHFPDHQIIAEESGNNLFSSQYAWIIDPLDGTTNFAHQLPMFAVSIGFAVAGEIVFGLVLNPKTGELFTAIKGQGAFLNGSPISVSKTAVIGDSLLVTGFPYNLKQHIQPLIYRFQNCLYAARGIRRYGSAALDLCYLACGRYDGFWEECLKPWDTAGGFIIAKEAGAMITDFLNRPFHIESNEILATNALIHSEMLDLMQLKE